MINWDHIKWIAAGGAFSLGYINLKGKRVMLEGSRGGKGEIKGNIFIWEICKEKYIFLF